MIDEEWRKIPDYSDYSVSDHGRVRRDIASAQNGKAKAGLILRLQSSQWGHKRVALYKNGNYERFLVHRLVATVFSLPRRNDQDCVAHNDGNPENNHLSNLRWSTAKENMADKPRHGTDQAGERNGMNRRTGLREPDVKEIRRLRSEGVPYAEITARFGVNKVTACAIYKRRNWKHVA
jgi:hypothetical protein